VTISIQDLLPSHETGVTYLNEFVVRKPREEFIFTKK
jgi:hypothetical protein